MNRLRILAALCAIGLWTPVPTAPLQAQDALTVPVDRGDSAQLRAIVSSGRHATQRWPVLRDVAGELTTLYDSSRWTPIWSRDGQPTASALSTIEQLSLIAARGLDPADYDVARLQQWSGSAGTRMLATAAERADFDMTLSSGTLRVLHALRHGRISANAAHAQLRFERAPFDAVAAVRIMATSGNPSLQFDDAEPPYLHYHLLKQALGRYRALARDSTLSPPVFRRTIQPDSSDAGIPQLRRWLVALSDLPQLTLATTTADSTRYDSVLVRGVRSFQSRHAIAVDGVIGPDTRARLQISLAARIAQMEITLERWRWLPHAFGTPPIFVNIPSFRMFAFKSNSDHEADLLSMDVVVGDAYDHKTPVFSATLQYIVFSPFWDVPASISRKEVLPKARRDAGYLARNHYEIVSNSGTVLSTSALGAVAAGQARIRQRPGKDNALGGVKFIFPNAFNVYMHDTPSQSLFALPRRDFSHGCIRLSEPARLAEFLLRDQPGWDAAAITAAMQQPEPQQVDLRTPVPVHVMYGTAIAREDGTVLFYDDIYGLDRQLERLIAGGYPFSR